MVSFGGKIIPRPHDNQLRYVGGDTRIVAVNRSITFSLLLSKLSKLLSNAVDFTVKYQLPNEELDALITVSTDEDVENMMEEFDRLSLSSSEKIPRLRLFLFPPNSDEELSRSSSIVSLLDGSRKRESWFLDALNGGSVGLERNKSEASSIVSEVPDYLFGLDNNSDDPPPPPVKFRNKSGLSEPAPGSDPGSPAFGSGSSAPPMPNLPPVKTKPEKTHMNPAEEVSGPIWGPGSPYPGHAVQQIPVYYVPATGSGPGMIGHGNVVPLSVPVQGQYMAQYGPGPGQVPVGYPGPGPMYEVQMQGNMVQGQGMNMNQPMYYGVKDGGYVATYSGSGMPVSGDDQYGSNGRTVQG
ncbi:putative medium-chain specific acyl-CoA dehydrogenase 2 mitochondrial [Bienertia sinuspersici]